LSSDDRGKVDAVAVAIKAEKRAVMDDALGVEAPADLGPLHAVERALFKHPGTDPAQHIVCALALQDEIVDPSEVQKPTQHQSSRSCSDNHNIGAHEHSPHSGTRMLV